MEVFFDETGSFRPSNVTGQTDLAAVMGVIIPELHAETLKADFTAFVNRLPRECFERDEAKGRLLSADQQCAFALMLNKHPGVMLGPVTFNRNIRSSSFSDWPTALKARLLSEASKCIHSTMQLQVEEVAKRCGNLSPEQLVRLLTYKVAVEKALGAIALFYHCKKYHNSYYPIKLIFDRTGASNNREELVFKDMIFLWVTRNVISTVKQIHTDSHPFVQLYGAEVGGKRTFNVAKMVRGNFEFRDSKQSWQLQIADMAAAIWVSSIRDQNNTRGLLPHFRILYRNSCLPKEQPVGLMSVAEVSSQEIGPENFNIFQRLVVNEAKILPCSWDVEN